MKVEHERALLLNHLVPGAAEIPHKTHRLLWRIVLFVLTTIGIAMLNLLLDELEVPKQGLVVGVLAIALAEFLINARRWWWTGVEEALWIGGVYSMISELPSRGTPESMLVLAAGAAIPGARVRNPLFGALAAGFVAAYFEKRFDLGVVASLVIALVAAVGLLRTWRRPSNEFLCIAVAVILPLVGYSQADAHWRTATISLYLGFGFATLCFAFRFRHHALFLAGAIGYGIAIIEAARTIDLPLEVKLAVAGALLLAGSWIVSTGLRGRTRGIVVTPAKLTPFDDDLEVVATVALPHEDFDQKVESGGRFGGAGATGEY